MIRKMPCFEDLWSMYYKEMSDQCVMKNNEITKRCIGRMQFESEILALLRGTHRTPAWSGAPRCSECSWTHWPPKALPLERILMRIDLSSTISGFAPRCPKTLVFAQTLFRWAKQQSDASARTPQRSTMLSCTSQWIKNCMHVFNIT